MRGRVVSERAVLKEFINNTVKWDEFASCSAECNVFSLCGAEGDF
jgi:hypothetical protein